MVGMAGTFFKQPLRSAFVIVLLACLAYAATPAHAQRHKGEQKQDPAAQANAAEKKKKAREIDDAYKSALKAIPDKPKSDPWGSMR
jgi:uncharacterized protein YecT (DUF1311 family)